MDFSGEGRGWPFISWPACKLPARVSLGLGIATSAVATSPGLAALLPRSGAPAPPHALSSPQQSADDHTLESDTSERLQLGLMGLAGAALGVHMLHGGCPPASRPASWGAPLGMCVGRLHSLRGRLRNPLSAGAAQSTCSGSLRQQLRQAPPGSTLAPAGSELTNNGRGLGAATAALTFAVPAARMLGSDRGRRRLGSRIKVCVWVGGWAGVDRWRWSRLQRREVVRNAQAHVRLCVIQGCGPAGVYLTHAALFGISALIIRCSRREQHITCCTQRLRMFTWAPSPPALVQGAIDGVGRLFTFRSGFKLSTALYAGAGVAGL